MYLHQVYNLLFTAVTSTNLQHTLKCIMNIIRTTIDNIITTTTWNIIRPTINNIIRPTIDNILQQDVLLIIGDI